MSDLEGQLDGLVDEIGAGRVRKLAKGLSADMARGGEVSNPLMRKLIVDYGQDAVVSAFRKMEESLDGQTVRREGTKVGRNAPCPCGSGKKHKKCCG